MLSSGVSPISCDFMSFGTYCIRNAICDTVGEPLDRALQSWCPTLRSRLVFFLCAIVLQVEESNG